MLVAASQHTNRKLRDIAAEVVAGGGLPIRPTLIDELLRRIGSAGQPATPSPAGYASAGSRPPQRAQRSTVALDRPTAP